MRRLPPVLIALVTAFAIAAPAHALAANQQVGVQDNVFTPSAVAVKPDESVTWSYPGGGDHHNVHFEDNSFTDPSIPSFGPWSATRTFTSGDVDKVFRYYCQEHGGPGGQGMAGVVYVNQAGTVVGIAPTASFTVSPAVAAAGRSVSFNGSASSDADGTIVRYEWDLDGDGSYETDTGAISSTAMTYAVPGMRTIKLRVTDSQGLTNEATRSLMVSAVPSASFTASPNPAGTGQTVSFNGSASRDSEGPIVKYEWDLDGNGSYETNTGTTPTASRSYAAAGTFNVKLRVTDNAGITGETTRSLRVNAPAPPPPPVTPTTPAATRCSSLAGARRTACLQRSCSKLRGTKRARCIQRSCRYVKGASRARCVLKSCRYLKGRARSACKLKSCRSLRGSKKRACKRKYRLRRK